MFRISADRVHLSIIHYEMTARIQKQYEARVLFFLLKL